MSPPITKPKHLSPEYASIFQDQSVVDVYHHRPPYPDAVFDALLDLIVDEPRTVLDLGCGPGNFARGLVSLVERVDATDISAPMIEKGRGLPGGDLSNLRWILGPAETVELDPPYALIVAGDSLHWMDWNVLLPRLKTLLTSRGVLALPTRNWGTFSAEETEIFGRYSVNQDFRPYSMIDALIEHGFFEKQGERILEPMPWRPTIDEYMLSRYSQNGFSRDRMTDEHLAAFDGAMRTLIDKLCRDGTVALVNERLVLEVSTKVIWGKPLRLSPAHKSGMTV